jgi:SAM-dependent methyltransferase
MDATLESFAAVESLLPNNHSASAHGQYKNIVKAMATNRSLLEIGAGRRPLLTSDEIEEFNIDYTANDLSERELELIPFSVRKALFDVCGDLPTENLNSYDVICSKMVQEHVQDGELFYQNIYRLLKVGGIAINLHPTLYSPPFLINHILPDHIADYLVRTLLRKTPRINTPRFPALYELCHASHRNETLIKDIGFSKVSILPFYFHEYFDRIPILRSIDRAMSAWAQAHDFRLLSSYAYTLVKK